MLDGAVVKYALVEAFCQDIFDVYNKHGINHHIPRPNGKWYWIK